MKCEGYSDMTIDDEKLWLSSLCENEGLNHEEDSSVGKRVKCWI